MTKTSVATTGTQKAPALMVVEDQLPAGYDMDELIADGASGPSLSADDVALPYISVLQTNSPQVNPAKPQYLPEARAGMLYNTVTNEIYEAREQGLIVVPCYYERRLVEWVDRDSGGGWVADYDPGDPIVHKARPNAKKKLELPNGNLLVETAYHYCLYQDPHTSVWSECVIAMSSTQLGGSRRWNNMIKTSKIPGTDRQAPRFLYAYNITTSIRSKGENSWFVFEATKVESPVSVPVYRAGKDFASLVGVGGMTRAAPPVTEAFDPDTGEIIEGHAEII